MGAEHDAAFCLEGVSINAVNVVDHSRRSTQHKRAGEVRRRCECEFKGRDDAVKPNRKRKLEISRHRYVGETSIWK